jgi:hypothetical protein
MYEPVLDITRELRQVEDAARQLPLAELHRQVQMAHVTHASVTHRTNLETLLGRQGKRKNGSPEPAPSMNKPKSKFIERLEVMEKILWERQNHE